VEHAVNALVLEHITKRFGAVLALDDVSLRVESGSVHALLGENGAGKSTLMRVVAGLVHPDSGSIEILGKKEARLDPARAIEAGVGMVHQHFMLVDTLTVAENVVLGQEPVRGPFVDLARAKKQVAGIAEEHGLGVDPAAIVGDLSVGERQRVEILKVLYRGAKLLVLDEPTAVLTPVETRALLDVVRKLAASGATVVVVTHKLDEVKSVADEASVLRRGRHVGDLVVADSSPADMARMMVGREVVLGEAPPRAEPLADDAGVALALERVMYRSSPKARPAIDGLSLEVHAGEILGIAGVEGNGQHELESLVAGTMRPERGRVLLGGEDVSILGPADRAVRGLGRIAGDRHREGLVLGLPLFENLSFGAFDELAPKGVLRIDAMRERADEMIEAFDVRPRDRDLPASALSGGNQQKVVVARALSRRSKTGSPGPKDTPRLLIAAQPTRGVDVGAIEEIWRRISEARDRGSAVLLISSELGELLALSDRIAVLVRGKIVETFARGDADTEKLGAAMLGASTGASKKPDAEAADA
jgi:simple sugar transport system ATP-binding protein